MIFLINDLPELNSASASSSVVGYAQPKRARFVSSI